MLYAAGKCDGSSSAVESETTNAINWGVSIMNVSWGGEPAGETNRPNDTDKWFDRQVIDGWKFLTVAAGNRGAADCVQGSDGRLLRPALGYNVLTVGNFNDRNSAEWGGDTPDIMAPCSSWVNPDSTRGDRAKPEVAAPGTNLWTARGTDAAPWMGNSSGTSVAAPFVAGLSALMIQADPVLDGWPEVVKAIIIATARHNIEGSSVFSEFDGAGGVYSLDAVRLAALEFGDWHGTSIDCSSAFPVLRSLPLVAGRQTRVAIAWDQNPDYANDEFRPSADHDLVIVNDD